MIPNPSEEDRQTAKRLEAETQEAMHQWHLAAEAVDLQVDLIAARSARDPELPRLRDVLEELRVVNAAREAEYREVERIRTRHEARTGVRFREQYEALQRATKGRIVMYQGRSFGVIRGRSRPTLYTVHFEAGLVVCFTPSGKVVRDPAGWRSKYGDLWEPV